jgi:hypothetical protein
VQQRRDSNAKGNSLERVEWEWEKLERKHGERRSLKRD